MDGLGSDAVRVLHAVVLPLALVVLGLQAANLAMLPPSKDGVHNVTFAYNLLRHGTFSRQRAEGDVKPSMYREPSWPALLAMAMAVHPGIDLDRDSKGCIVHGESACVAKVAQLKLVNVVLWVVTAYLAALAAFVFTASVPAAVGVFLLVSFSIGLGLEANRFYSEIAAAVTVLAISLALARAARPSAGIGWFAAVGALAGLLMLTKAVYQPFALVAAGALAALGGWRGLAARRIALQLGVLLGCTLLVAGPWMLRNALHFGTVSISGRQHNLLFRANLSRLPAAAYPAAFLFFTPEEPWLDGARARLLTPERTVLVDDRHPEGAYQRGHDRIRELKREARASGASWDALARAEALVSIRAHWVGYLAASLPLGWRAIFAEQGWGVHAVDGAADAWAAAPVRFALAPKTPRSRLVLSLGLFAAFLGVGAMSLGRRAPLGLFLLPAAYGYVAYVMTSHAWPRFTVPLLPVFAVCAGVAGWGLVRHAQALAGERGAPLPAEPPQEPRGDGR